MNRNHPSRRAFLTGSFAYGTPRRSGPEAQQSDIDLVVLVSEEDAEELRYMADNRTGSGAKESLSLRFGKLNLIVETREDKYDAWKTWTRALKKVRENRKKNTPSIDGCGIARTFAVDVFIRFFASLTRTVFSFDFRRATLEERRAWENERVKKIMDEVGK